MTTARHYTVQEWADFARGLGDDGTRSGMQRHIDAGCERCGEFVAMLQRFTPIAASEDHYEPSDEAVRRAEALFQS